MPDTTAFQRSLPNVLTSLRVGLAAALFVVLSVWPGGPRPSPDGLLLAAAGVFALAAGTDALDGHLARKWKVVSIFGRIMDPFADKILVVGAFILLAGPAFAAKGPGGRVQVSGVEPWMAVVVLARELLVTSIRAVAEGSGKDFSTGLSGKLKMIVQSMAIPVILLTLAVEGPAVSGPARALILAAAWCTVVVTALSALPYITRGARTLAGGSHA